MIFKKRISQDLIDNNDHLNISNYIKLADNSNSKMLKILKQKNYYFVAKKILMENNKEILLNNVCTIKSFLVAIDDYSIVSRHDFFTNKNKIQNAKCYMLQISIQKKNKRIMKINHNDKNYLKKFLKKNYINPFKL
jgi:acyl-CoA thioesterase FadM